MSPKHAAPEPEEQPVPEPQPEAAKASVAYKDKPLNSRIFDDRNMPHLGMLFITVIYVGFCLAAYLTTGSFAAVPQTVSLAFSATLGLWFNYLTRQHNKEPDQ